MARLIFEGLSMGDAKELANWYCGQGEQQADVWFECQDADKGCSENAPTVDCHKTYDQGKFKYLDEDKQELTIHLKS